ncbi:MAG: glycosyltransferase family 4 protein [Actinomycetota bacterium]|nr:glycosyltransferase family 4 protein [Actinomycetota bacterium]
MKIVFLSWRDLAHPLAGGSEVLVDRLARGLLEHGHEVSLVCGGPVANRPYQIRDGGGTYSQYLRAPATYMRRFRDHDLVIDVANGMTFFTPLWRRRPVICLVNHVHTSQWGQWFPRPIAALGRSLERRAMPRVYRGHLFVAVSASTAASLEAIGVAPDLIRIVPNGTDPVPASHPKSREPLFLSLGRLVPHKRVDLLLEAWEQVRPRVGGRLVIAGTGPEAARLTAMAGERVEFVGRVSEADKQRLLSEAWLLLHPAMFEGWGLVVMEAAAAGTPTVGFDVLGLRDSVAHAKTGMLADCRESFLEYWIALAEDTHRRSTMGLLARQRAARYSWSSSVERFLSVAEEAVADRPARVPLPVSAALARSGTPRSVPPW